jgi:hypothetical protein
MAKDFEKGVLQKCLFLLLYTREPISFSKKHINPRTLLSISAFLFISYVQLSASCLASSIWCKDGTSMTRARICKRLRSPGIDF